MRIASILNEKEITLSCEVFPPKHFDGIAQASAVAQEIAGLHPSFMSVTYGAAGSTPGHTIAVAKAVAETGVTPLCHLTCVQSTREHVQHVLADMKTAGMENVLALRGDCGPNERHFMPHPQGHSHAIDLVRQIAAMNRGQFVDGEVEECHHSKFSIGVAGYPEVHAEARDITSDIARLRDKVDAGAEYVITQMFFDNAKYFDFVRRCREAGITVPIIPGIKPLSTLRHLEILPETFGVKLPEELVREVKAHPDGVREVGTEWAIAQSRELMAAGVPVLHYYTMSRTTNIQKIVKAVF